MDCWSEKIRAKCCRTQHQSAVIMLGFSTGVTWIIHPFSIPAYTSAVTWVVQYERIKFPKSKKKWIKLLKNNFLKNSSVFNHNFVKFSPQIRISCLTSLCSVCFFFSSSEMLHPGMKVSHNLFLIKKSNKRSNATNVGNRGIMSPQGGAVLGWSWVSSEVCLLGSMSR